MTSLFTHSLMLQVFLHVQWITSPGIHTGAGISTLGIGEQDYDAKGGAGPECRAQPFGRRPPQSTGV